MSDSNQNPPASQPPAPPAEPPKLNPVAVLSALGSEIRWPIIKMLADGRVMSVGQIAAALGRDIDGIGRQMKVMFNAGVVETDFGQDRRQTVYQIPAVRRQVPGVLDYGFCVIDLKKL
jgi:hypothetical protein